MCITSVEKPVGTGRRHPAGTVTTDPRRVLSRRWYRPPGHPRGAPHQLAPGLDRRGSFMRASPLGELTNDVRRPADRLSSDGWPLHGRPCGRLIRSFLPRRKTRKLRHLSGGCACRAPRLFPVPHPAAFRVHTRSSWHRPRPTAGIDHAPLFSDALRNSSRGYVQSAPPFGRTDGQGSWIVAPRWCKRIATRLLRKPCPDAKANRPRRETTRIPRTGCPQAIWSAGYPLPYPPIEASRGGVSPGRLWAGFRRFRSVAAYRRRSEGVLPQCPLDGPRKESILRPRHQGTLAHEVTTGCIDVPCDRQELRHGPPTWPVALQGQMCPSVGAGLGGAGQAALRTDGDRAATCGKGGGRCSRASGRHRCFT